MLLLIFDHKVNEKVGKGIKFKSHIFLRKLVQYKCKTLQ